VDLVALDYESYYSLAADGYTLSRMTTEAYVRDPRFEALMVGIKIGDGKSYTVTGQDIGPHLHSLNLEQHAVLCHHAHFDCLILNHHYGIRPKVIFDTLAMARAEIGSVAAKGLSLGSISEHLGLGAKGHEVVLAQGKHRKDFTEQEWREYRMYCCNDVELTHRIYQKLMPKFCTSELRLIDLTTRLFTEPVLELDVPLLEEYKDAVLREKEFLMLRAGVDRAELTSNPKFAEILRRMGVEPGMKDSPTAKNEDGTPKQTYAFAKTDQFMMDLQESEDETITFLAEARLGVKTSIAETRAQRFISMAGNGPACIYLRYWGAEQTGRHGGGDKTNFQNLGRSASITEDRAVQGLQVYTPEGQARIVDPGAWGLTKICTDAGQFWPKQMHRIGLRDSIRAPEGSTLVVGDSSNIEARMVCWVAGQEDVVEKYRAGEDLYCDMASDTYGYKVNKNDHPKERQLGKVAVLGLGFGMGKEKFYNTATGAQWRIEIEKSVTDNAVEVFRDKYYKVAAYWKFLNEQVIPAMAEGREMFADPHGLIRTTHCGLILPNGRTLRYPKLHQRKNPDPESYFKTEWVFDCIEGKKVSKTRLYGGKLCENIVQALARIAVLDQAVVIGRRYKVAMLVHDEVVCCVSEDQAEACEKYMLEVMSTPPAWALTLPVAAETGAAKVYSLAK
jgi:DNA polymerase